MARRRDRSNELIAAIVVIGTLALALTFGIILSLSSNSETSDIQDTPTAAVLSVTLSPTFTPSKTASPTMTPAPKRTLIPITDTSTHTPTPFGLPVAVAYWPDTNVRTGPSTDEPSVGQIQPGTPYPVLGERANWYLIEYPASPAGSGWVYSQVVQLGGDLALIPIVTEAESTATTAAALVAQQTTDAVARDLNQTLTAIAVVPTITPSLQPTLTPSPQPTLTPSPTAEPSATASPQPSLTSSPPATTDAALVARQTADAVARDLDQTLTAIAVVPTITPSPEPTLTPSPTAEPSATPTPEPSFTPSPTAEPSETPTPEPSSTSTPTETLTVTSTLTPTATPTRVSTATPRPTATPTHTPTLAPTATNTATPTDTPTPTFTFTPSNTPTSTLTPTPSVTLTFTPYPTLTPSITPFAGEQTATPSASGCLIPEDWIKYAIRPGNTMFGLALQFGLTVDELAAANCIAHPNNITAGQILYVPPGSNVTPPPPGTSTTAATGNYASVDCGNPSWTITQPRPGTVLRGTFAVYGTATHPQFSFYRLQISGSDTNDADFATLQVYQTPVTNGELGTINTAAFAPGDYWLRLTVVDITGNYPPQCTVRVRFEP